MEIKYINSEILSHQPRKRKYFSDRVEGQGGINELILRHNFKG